MAWCNRGWARRRQGRPREALDDLDRSLGIDDRNAIAWSNRGYARQETGNAAGAIGDFEKAITLDPSLEPELAPLIRRLRTAEKPAGPAPPPVPRRAKAPAPAPPASRPPPFISSPEEYRIFVGVCVSLSLITILLGFLRIPILSDPFTRAVDLPWKIGWIVAHFSDPAAFPPQSNLCMEPFCVRTDTEKKYVTGRRGYTSEERYHYCPAHEPGFLKINHRSGGTLLFIYWILVVIVSGLLLIPLLIMLSRVPLWPWLLVLVILGRQPLRILVPTGDDESTKGLDGILSLLGFWAGLLIFFAAWILFIWF